MLKQLFSRTSTEPRDTVEEDGAPGLDRMKAAYEAWRITQDIGAIMAAFDRLSDRRLALIGLRRSELYDAVTEMMDEVRQQERIGEDVLALLDQAPATGEEPRLAAEAPDEVPTAPAAEERTAA